MAVSPDGGCLATAHAWDEKGAQHGCVVLWNVKAGQRRACLMEGGDYVSGVSFSPDGGTLVAARIDGTLAFWAVDTLEQAGAIRTTRDRLYEVAFSPDGRLIATAHGRKRQKPGGNEIGYAILWDVLTKRRVALLGEHEGQTRFLAFSASGAYLATGDSDDKHRVWDVRTGALVQTFEASCWNNAPVAFSPDGRYLACGEGTTRLWLLPEEMREKGK